ncbi:contractile injection system protein, VgrG/Pvc8 family, partial [Pseudomonas sp. 32_A]|uniref:contractile injection system protein, VgrG/Pvc8 family n=1 Tax=Pseudomonas sp. 32_A TaxID=2813559 RepID=UPI001A9E41A9
HAQQPPEDKAPVLPVREIYDGQRAGRFDTIDDAQRFAEQRLDALRLPKRIHYGAGSSRTLEIGAVHTLAGYLDRAITFVPLSIEHEAVNNLGADIGALLGRGELERFADWRDGRPQTELNFKRYRQATNKIVGISNEAAAFLDTFLR